MTGADLYEATRHTEQVFVAAEARSKATLRDLFKDDDDVLTLETPNAVFNFNDTHDHRASINHTVNFLDGQNEIQLAHDITDYSIVFEDGDVIIQYLGEDGFTPGAKVRFTNFQEGDDSIRDNVGRLQTKLVDGEVTGSSRGDSGNLNQLFNDNDGIVDLGLGNDIFSFNATGIGFYTVNGGGGTDTASLRHTIEDYSIIGNYGGDDELDSITFVIEEGGDETSVTFTDFEEFLFLNKDRDSETDYTDDRLSFEDFEAIFDTIKQEEALAEGLQDNFDTTVEQAEAIGVELTALISGLGLDPTAFDADGDLTASLDFSVA